MKFKSRRDPLFTSIFIIILLIISWITFEIIQKENLNTSDYISLCIVIGAFIFIAWGFKTTNYEITENHIKYKSGFINGSIDIKNIQSIITDTTLWVGLKPAMARNGLIIRHNKYDEIYISPETNVTFISELLKRNNTINIIKN